MSNQDIYPINSHFIPRGAAHQIHTTTIRTSPLNNFFFGYAMYELGALRSEGSLRAIVRETISPFFASLYTTTRGHTSAISGKNDPYPMAIYYEYTGCVFLSSRPIRIGSEKRMERRFAAPPPECSTGSSGGQDVYTHTYTVHTIFRP